MLKPSKRKRRKLNRGIAVEEEDGQSESGSDSEPDVKRMEGEPSENIKKTSSDRVANTLESQQTEMVVESQEEETQLAPERCACFTQLPSNSSNMMS